MIRTHNPKLKMKIEHGARFIRRLTFIVEANNIINKSSNKYSIMASFSVPFVTSTPDTWGPPSIDDANPNAPGNVSKFAELPYAPFGRSDRLGRAADFTSSNRGYGHHGQQQYFFQQSGGGRRGRDYRRASAAAAAAQAEDEEGDSFQLVDTTKAMTTNKRFVNPASKRRQHSQRLRQINARRAASSGGAGAASAGPGGLDKMTRGGGRGGRGGGRYGGRGGRGGRYGGRGGRGYGGWSNRVDRQPSVAIKNDWKQVDEIDLGKINKNLTSSTDVPTPEDMLWCGFLDPYNDAYDKVTARQPVPLKRMEHKEFYPVTTTDDPVMEKLAIDGAGDVFISDSSKFFLCCLRIFHTCGHNIMLVHIYLHTLLLLNSSS